MLYRWSTHNAHFVTRKKIGLRESIYIHIKKISRIEKLLKQWWQRQMHGEKRSPCTTHIMSQSIYVKRCGDNNFEQCDFLLVMLNLALIVKYLTQIKLTPRMYLSSTCEYVMLKSVLCKESLYVFLKKILCLCTW